MFFRPIEPRGDVLDAMRHLLALALLLPVSFIMVVGHQWLATGQALATNFLSAIFVVAMQFFAMLFHPMGWMYLAAVFVVTFLLHFAFYGSVMTVLHRSKALSLANLLVATTVLAALGGLLPVLTGYGGSSAPKYRVPLLEDYADTFLTYAILLAIGALAEWLCLRTGPAPAKEAD